MKKLLIIDDDPDILTICRYSFETVEGLETRFCSSGEEGIREALAFNPDLILLDAMMPVMDGEATFKALKQLPSLAKTPIVFLTAKLQEDEIRGYRELGAADVLRKPFDPIKISGQVLEIYRKTASRS